MERDLRRAGRASRDGRRSRGRNAAGLSRTRELAESASREVLRVRTECANHDAHHEHLADPGDAVLAEENAPVEETLRLRRAEGEETRARRAAYKDDLAAAERNLFLGGARRGELENPAKKSSTGTESLCDRDVRAIRFGRCSRGLHDSFEGSAPAPARLLAKSGARNVALGGCTSR